MAMTHRLVPDVASREVVPTSLWPNFRDHGRTVDRPLLRVATNLQARYGRAWASEGGLRKMICEDVGHMPGKTTIAKALVRLALQGLVVQVWLVAGQILPTQEVCTHGTRLVWVPRGDRQRRAAKRFTAAQPDGRQYRTRNVGFDVRQLTAKIAAAERPSMPPAPEPDYRARALEQLERARREHPELFTDEKNKKPPD
jgi:hypothetical protein